MLCVCGSGEFLVVTGWPPWLGGKGGTHGGGAAWVQVPCCCIMHRAGSGAGFSALTC
jgi:hypothetical protein